MGAVGHATGSPAVAALARFLEPFGKLWIAALQMLVLPLVLTHVMAAVINARNGGVLGAIGGRALALFLVMLAAMGILTIAVAATIVTRHPVDPGTAAMLRESVPVPDAAELAGSPLRFGDWISGLFPTNLFAAAGRGEVLPLLLFAVFLALAIARLPDDQRTGLSRAIAGLAAALLTITRWVLLLVPAGVFVLILPVVLGTGGTTTRYLVAYIVIQCALVLVMILLQYPFASVVGRIPVRVFARGLLPAQLVAASTRSSIAALPALVQGGRDRMGLPPIGTGVVLPLSVAVFKQSLVVTAPLRLFFLAHVYQIPLTPATVTAFLVTVILLSFGTVGLPSAAGFSPALPAYMAAGIPLEGVVILEAVDAIPDVFKTVLNVTGHMSVATILTRSSRSGAQPSA